MHKPSEDRRWRRPSDSPQKSRWERFDNDELSYLIHLTDDARSTIGLSLRVEMLRDLIHRGGALLPPINEPELPND